MIPLSLFFLQFPLPTVFAQCARIIFFCLSPPAVCCDWARAHTHTRYLTSHLGRPEDSQGRTRGHHSHTVGDGARVASQEVTQTHTLTAYFVSRVQSVIKIYSAWERESARVKNKFLPRAASIFFLITHTLLPLDKFVARHEHFLRLHRTPRRRRLLMSVGKQVRRLLTRVTLWRSCASLLCCRELCKLFFVIQSRGHFRRARVRH